MMERNYTVHQLVCSHNLIRFVCEILRFDSVLCRMGIRTLSDFKSMIKTFPGSYSSNSRRKSKRKTNGSVAEFQWTAQTLVDLSQNSVDSKCSKSSDSIRKLLTSC